MHTPNGICVVESCFCLIGSTGGRGGLVRDGRWFHEWLVAKATVMFPGSYQIVQLLPRTFRVASVPVAVQFVVRGDLAEFDPAVDHGMNGVQCGVVRELVTVVTHNRKRNRHVVPA